MASQDETPTPDPVETGTAGAGARPGKTGGSGPEVRPDAGHGAHPAGEDTPAPEHDEHDAWDAAFAAAEGQPAQATPDAAGSAGTTGSASAGTAGTTGAEGATGSAAPEEPERRRVAAERAGSRREAQSDAGQQAPGFARVETVPGGHPSLPQRSSLPMRRASTLPDISRLAAGRTGGPASVLDGPDSARDGQADTAAAVAPERARSSEADAKAAESTESAGSVETGGSAGSAESAAPAARATPSEESARAAVVESGRGVERGSGSVTDPETTKTPAVDSPRRAARGASAAAVPAAVGPAAGSAAVAAGSAGAPEESGQGTGGDSDLSEEEAAEARRRAAEREAAGTARPVLPRILQVMIAVFFPVMLLAAAIRAVATPLFLWVEYHRPGFPADAYGFSTEDRMTYGSYAVDYLLNWSGPRYLGDLVGADGEPLYLDTEVSHMADVKAVLTVAFLTALAMLLLSILAAVYLARRSPGGIRRALFGGAVLTLVLVGALAVTAVLSWEQFFTQMHNVFFSQGNWTFRLDDTLIRLFPAQFWMDAGIAIGVIVLLACLAVIIAAWPTRRRRERDRAAREAARTRYLDSLEGAN